MLKKMPFKLKTSKIQQFFLQLHVWLWGAAILRVASLRVASLQVASCESASCESASCDRGFELYFIQKDEYGIKTK